MGRGGGGSRGGGGGRRLGGDLTSGYLLQRGNTSRRTGLISNSSTRDLRGARSYLQSRVRYYNRAEVTAQRNTGQTGWYRQDIASANRVIGEINRELSRRG